MSVIVPNTLMPPGLLVQMKAKLASDIQEVVRASSTGVAGQQLTYRDLLPNDVGIYSGETLTGPNIGRTANPALVAETPFPNSFPNFTATSFQSFGIYGYASLSPNPLIDEIDFSVGSAATLAKIPLDILYAEQDVIGYFSDPLIYNPQETVNVTLLSQVAVAAGTESFQILGYVAEPVGRNVTPRATIGLS